MKTVIIAVLLLTAGRANATGTPVITDFSTIIFTSITTEQFVGHYGTGGGFVLNFFSVQIFEGCLFNDPNGDLPEGHSPFQSVVFGCGSGLIYRPLFRDWLASTDNGFRLTDQGTYCVVGVDTGCREPISEPASWLLLLAGIGILGYARPRRALSSHRPI